MAAACSSSSSAQASAMTLPNVPLASLDAGVFRNVLSFLEPDDVSDLASASRDLRRKTITQSGSLLIGQTRTFIQGICAELGDDEKYAVQREALQRVLGSFTPSASSSSSSSSSSTGQIIFRTLRDVQKHSALFREAILDALEGLDLPTIERCERSIPAPENDEYIWATFWTACRVYEQASSGAELSAYDTNMFQEIAYDLLYIDKEEKALELVSKIPSREKLVVVRDSLKLGKVGFAVRVVRSIPDELIQSIAIQEIAFDFMRKGNQSKAELFAIQIPIPSEREQALEEIRDWDARQRAEQLRELRATCYRFI